MEYRVLAVCMRSLQNALHKRPVAGSPAKALPQPGISLPSFLDSISPSPTSQSADVFDGPNCVYLSPHHDDVCFSLGAFVRRHPGGRLINLFTRSGYSLSPPAGIKPDIDAVTRCRVEEDNAFAAACHLNKLDLMLEDAPLHGRSPMDLSHIEEDRAVLRGPLLAKLRAMAAETPADERLTLFCPAAIGGHANHVATMQAVVAALSTLVQRYRVLFYEDLHYAANPYHRRSGLLRLFAALSGRRGRRITIGFGGDADAKLALVRLYRSQFAALPETCRRYSPDCEDEAVGLHEAIWDFDLGAAVTLRGSPGAERNSEPAPYRPPGTVDAKVTEGQKPARELRIALNTVMSAAARDKAPLVSCLMVTANRHGQARLAVECYRRQSWPRRQLVIVDTSDGAELGTWLSNLNDPTINYKHLARGNRTLGDLRNLAAGRARGEFICIWDDDDLHHPLRIEAQMTALTATQAAACVLGRVMVWWPSHSEISMSKARPWEGTLLCRRKAMPRYESANRTEDTPALNALLGRQRVVHLNAPELYVYVRHASNTWDEEHFEGIMRASRERFATAEYAGLMARLATAYPVREYKDAIGA